jgi:hypothetical protein
LPTLTDAACRPLKAPVGTDAALKARDRDYNS